MGDQQAGAAATSRADVDASASAGGGSAHVAPQATSPPASGVAQQQSQQLRQRQQQQQQQQQQLPQSIGALRNSVSGDNALAQSTMSGRSSDMDMGLASLLLERLYDFNVMQQ